jgi:cytochrome c553
MYHLLCAAKRILVGLTLGLAAIGASFAQKAPPPQAQVCIGCHGVDGNPIQPDYPRLNGQTARYLYLQLRDYKAGRRTHELMTPMVANLSREDMDLLADYFAAQKVPPQNYKPDPKRAALGKAKADETLCTMCHLGGFSGQNEIPKVAGQNFDYIVKQLREFKAMKRTNDAGSMTSVSKTMSDEDILNVAHYIVGL